MIILINAVIIAILCAVGLKIAWRKKKESETAKTKYRAFFIMGRIWILASIVLMGIYFIFQIPFYIGVPLFVLGLVFLIIGLINRGKWEEVR